MPLFTPAEIRAALWDAAEVVMESYQGEDRRARLERIRALSDKADPLARILGIDYHLSRSLLESDRPRLIELDGEGLDMPLLESVLLEKGFTGRVKINTAKGGYYRCYAGGKIVSCASQRDHTGKTKHERATDWVRKSFEGGIQHSHITRLRKKLERMTLGEIRELKRALGVQASGSRASLIGKIAARAFKTLADKRKAEKTAGAQREADDVLSQHDITTLAGKAAARKALADVAGKHGVDADRLWQDMVGLPAGDDDDEPQGEQPRPDAKGEDAFVDDLADRIRWGDISARKAHETLKHNEDVAAGRKLGNKTHAAQMAKHLRAAMEKVGLDPDTGELKQKPAETRATQEPAAAETPAAVAEPKPLTTADAAKHLKVAPRTVSKWVDSGRLAATREEGTGNRLIRPADLAAFMRDYNMDVPPDLASLAGDGEPAEDEETEDFSVTPAAAAAAQKRREARYQKAQDDLRKSSGGGGWEMAQQYAKKRADALSMRRADWLKKHGEADGLSQASREHEQFVHDAVARGESVPDEITVDYPDLHRDIIDSRTAAKTLRQHLADRGHSQDAIDKVMASPLSGKSQRIDTATGASLGSFAAISAREHREAVKRMVAAGKDVPASVLADYPDLAGKAKGADTTPTDTPTSKADDALFTGTDSQGRQWVNGELVAAKDEPAAGEKAGKEPTATTPAPTQDTTSTTPDSLDGQSSKGYIDGSGEKQTSTGAKPVADIQYPGKQTEPHPITLDRSTRMKGERDGATVLQVNRSTRDAIKAATGGFVDGAVVRVDGQTYKVERQGNPFRIDGTEHRYLYMQPINGGASAESPAPSTPEPVAPVEQPAKPVADSTPKGRPVDLLQSIQKLRIRLANASKESTDSTVSPERREKAKEVIAQVRQEAEGLRQQLGESLPSLPDPDMVKIREQILLGSTGKAHDATEKITSLENQIKLYPYSPKLKMELEQAIKNRDRLHGILNALASTGPGWWQKHAARIKTKPGDVVMNIEHGQLEHPPRPKDGPVTPPASEAPAPTSPAPSAPEPVAPVEEPAKPVADSTPKGPNAEKMEQTRERMAAVRQQIADVQAKRAKGSVAKLRSELEDLEISLGGATRRAVEAGEIGLHDLTREQWAGAQVMQTQAEGARQAHREAVEKALADGKTVRPEVLADYPDLAEPKPAAPVGRVTRQKAADHIASVLSRAGYNASPWSGGYKHRVYIKDRNGPVGHIEIGEDGTLTPVLQRQKGAIMSEIPTLDIEPLVRPTGPGYRPDEDTTDDEPRDPLDRRRPYDPYADPLERG